MTLLADLMAHDMGPRTHAQMCELTSRRTVDRAVARGDVVRLLPNQYCLATHAQSWHMRARAAVEWAGRGAALSGLAALAAYGFAPWPVETIDVVVPKGRHKRGPSWLRVRSLSAAFDTRVWVPSTAVVEPSLAVVMAHGMSASSRRAHVVHGAIHAGLVDVPKLERELTRASRLPGRADLARRLLLAGRGAESYLEEQAMVDVFRGVEFAGLVFQHEMVVEGRRYRIDAYDPVSRTAFELDGYAKHGTKEHRQRDVTRDAMLAKVGVLTVRFTYDDVTLRAAWCREVMLAAISQRSR